MGKKLLDIFGLYEGAKDAGKDWDGGRGLGISIRDNTRTTQKEIPAAYGTIRIGGNWVYVGFSGSNNKDMWVVMSLAEGECNAIHQVDSVDQVFLGDKLYNEYGGKVSYWFHGGSSTQAVDSNLNAALGEWTDPLRYLCYIVFKCEYHKDYFQTTPEFTVTLQGKKVYDFRSETTAYSNNVVLCMHDFITSSRHGPGLATSKIHYPSWIAAANYCDEKGFTYNGIFAKNQPIGIILDDMRAHFRGRMNWFNGKYYLRYADLNYESVAMELTDDHLFQDNKGSLEVTLTEPSVFSLPDGIKVKWRDPDNAYVEDDLPIGDEVGIIKTINLLGCTNRETAGKLGVYHLERALLSRHLTTRLRGDAIRLEPWDIVKVNWDDLGLTNQYLRVMDISLNKEGHVDAGFVYESLELYDDIFNILDAQTYQCTLPDPADVPGSVTGVTLTEELYNYRLQTYTRLIVEATGPNHPNFGGVNVWKSFDDINYEFFSFVEGSPGGSVDFSLDPVEEGITYYLIMTSVSIFGPEQSLVNGYKASRKILGLEAAPACLAAIYAIANNNAINIYGQKLSDPDIEVYEFRLGGWTGGIFLASLRSPNLSLYGVKPGDHIFYANTLSTNGQYCETPKSASVSLPEPPTGYTVQATDYCYYNLAQNGHFSAAITGWTGIDCTLASVSGGQVGNCLEITRTGGTFQDAWVTLGKFTSQVTIDISLYVKSGTSGDEGYQFFIWNVDDASYVGSAQSGTSSGSWIEDTYQIQIGAGDVGDELRLYLRKNTATAGTMLFDEVMVTISDEYKNVEYVTYSNDDYLKCSHEGFITNTGDYALNIAGTNYSRAQAWRPFLRISALNSLQLYLKKTGSPSGNLKAYIYDDDSGPNTLIATSDNVDVSGFGTSLGWIAFNFSTPPTLNKDQKYYIVIKGSDITQDGSNYVSWGYDSAGNWGTNAWYDSGGGWTEIAGDDMNFKADRFTGRFTSREYDRGSSGTYLVYLLADIVVTGAGTTWGDVIPSPDTWADIGIEERTWAEIFSLEAAPEVHMKLYWGDTSGNLTNSAGKMEILSAIVTGRYFQWEITLRDPSDAVEVLVENFAAKFCQ